MPARRSLSPRRPSAPRLKSGGGRPADWQAPSTAGNAVVPSALTRPLLAPVDYEEQVYAPLENPAQSAMAKVYEAIAKGKATVEDAVLFCGRFNEDGVLLREGRGAKKPYRLVRTRGHAEFREALGRADTIWQALPGKAGHARAFAKREAVARVSPKAWRAMDKVARAAALREDFFTSSSDLGSTFSPDPNQYSEFTPFFNGPFNKQQYFDYFAGHARAFEAYNHNPVAKRIVDIMVQYAFGRGFRVQSKTKRTNDRWRLWAKEKRLAHNIRKYWGREYLIYGENFIDKLRVISVDPSTIYDIICEGYDEFIDDVLYYQQMFQTATQLYPGIAVPGVPGSKQSKTGRYIIRQIPYDQIIHIKTGVMSVEKRGRSILYSVLTWLKRLTDTLNAQVLGEQLRASFVFDDTVKGTATDVAEHAAQYNYIPVAPSLFVHNEAIERKPLAPMQGVTAGAANVVQEILALIATGMGIPKDHFNVMTSGSGSRATAIVGSEPFTKVIEDLQEDFSDLLHQLIEVFCQQSGIAYDEDDWQITFPSVVKDSLMDRLKANAFCETMGWCAPRRAAEAAAAEMEWDEYDYDEEMQEREDDLGKGLGAPKAQLTPFGQDQEPTPADAPPAGGGKEDADNPTKGAGKKKVIAQHKKL